MNVVITQPNFLPWLGYLAQLASCDVFVCLDNVQFNRREWQNRNRIVTRQGKIDYLTVNVSKNARNSSILQTYISPEYKSQKLEEQIEVHYRGCPLAREGGRVCAPLYSAYHNSGVSMAEANIDQLLHIREILGLQTRIERSSVLEKQLSWNSPTERLLAICQSLGATTYLSSIGARPYMMGELHKFAAAGIEVRWQAFEHTSYVDGGPFVSHLSCIDFLHHHPTSMLVPYVLSCNRFISEADCAMSIVP